MDASTPAAGADVPPSYPGYDAGQAAHVPPEDGRKQLCVALGGEVEC